MGGSRQGGGANNLGGGGEEDGGPIGPPATRQGPALFFDQIQDVRDPGPLMGEDYEKWADSLRSVEEVLDAPELRSDASKILDRARAYRVDYRRNDTAPQWDLVQVNVLSPLMELRDRVSEELSRREKDNPLVPIDHDPVPGPYRDLVRKYYEKLATGQ